MTAAGLHLVVVDDEGHVVHPMEEWVDGDTADSTDRGGTRSGEQAVDEQVVEERQTQGRGGNAGGGSGA